jgi:hypothetical protein
MEHCRLGLHGWVIVALGLSLGACGGDEEVAAPATAGTPGSSIANRAPTIAGSPATSAVAGTQYSFTPTVTDANGGTLTFSIANLPSWATFSSTTGRVQGTPAAANVGTFANIAISVSDGQDSVQLAPFSIVVSDAANRAPTITGTPTTTVAQGAQYVFAPVASDPDGDSLTFSIANKPAWASFIASSGTLSGIPPTGAAGTYSNIQISVTDGQTKTSLPAFSIVVGVGENSAPTISGNPPTTAPSGQAYVFKPSASDPEGQALRFSITGLPVWATFDTATGALAGTPSATAAGTYSSIVISVSDGLASSALAPFSITVTSTNAPPTISGAPPTSATVDQAYSFTPSASDKDGQTLKFSIANKPAWAQFSTSTGRLYGTPTAANLGTFSNIVISVSDGQASTSLGAFALTVKSGTLGTATLSWLPPTENVDGTPVTNLAGYRIAYGQSATNLSQLLTIPNSGITSAMIEGLASGTWYFAVKAYTTSNVESDLSNLAQKTVY